MTIRPDIAHLIHAGHTDASIAHRLGCHRSTVHRTRQALNQRAAKQAAANLAALAAAIGPKPWTRRTAA